MQAMCCVGKNIFVLWEWYDTILPRCLEDMGSLSKAIHGVLMFKQIILDTRNSVKEMKKKEARLREEKQRGGYSSPVEDTDSPWRGWFLAV